MIVQSPSEGERTPDNPQECPAKSQKNHHITILEKSQKNKTLLRN